MKKIEAIIRQATLDTVVEALVRIGVPGMTLAHVRGSGRPKGHRKPYRGPKSVVDLLSEVKLEVLAPDEQVARIVGTLQAAVQPSRIGDGKISIWPVEKVIRIRTGEEGKRAVSCLNRATALRFTASKRC
jgi:nitrogen regulatory protein P-II 1